MFNNVVLDVFIGLIFVFLLYSLLATILQELISRWFSLRSRMLLKALRRMLEDDKEPEGYWQGSTIAGFFIELYNMVGNYLKPFKDGESFIRKFYSHPTIKKLGEGRVSGKPSYLHAHNFSQTIIQLLRGDMYDGRNQNESGLVSKALDTNALSINEETLKHLKILFYDSRQDTYLFKYKLEDWFEETMERATSWYKKQIQTVLLFLGFGLAIAFNVDTIAITKILLKDKKAREQLVQLATNRQKEYSTVIDSVNETTVSRTETKVNDSTVLIKTDTVHKKFPSDKYVDSAYKMLAADAVTVQGILGLKGIEPGQRSSYQKDLFLVFIGWLLTAFAISLGAPFWFDLLNRFVKMRESGPKPINNSAIDNSVGHTAVKTNDGKDIRG